MSLSGKNILITGASTGIGKACAIECCKAGAALHLIARNMNALNELLTDLGQGRHSIHQLDVTNSNAIEPTIKDIVAKYGKIDGFIHSVGIHRIQPFGSINKSHYLDTFSINTISAFDICRVLVRKQYRVNKGLSIIFISSVMSVTADAGLTSYCASKAALVGGARAMAIELASESIRVNCVSPGTVEDTPMTHSLKSQINANEYQRIVDRYPFGIGCAKDIAQLCVFLSSDDSTWITGQNIVIDGGYSIV